MEIERNQNCAKLASAIASSVLMPEELPHPISTPKGASAVTILLGVVSVVAPFLFNRSSAVFFSIVALCVIIWLYWPEARAATMVKKWAPQLNVPIAAILTITLMAIIVSHGSEKKFEGPSPINADDIAERVEKAVRADIPKPITDPIPAQQKVIVTVKPFPMPAETSLQSQKITPPDFNEQIQKIVADSKAKREHRDRIFACSLSVTKTTGGLAKLDNEAINDENTWAYTRDDKTLRAAYETWLGKSQQYIADNFENIPESKGFESAEDQDGNWYIIHNLGVHTWNKFDAKRKAIENIIEKVNKIDCEKRIPTAQNPNDVEVK